MDDLTVGIDIGGALPVVGKPMYTRSELTDSLYEITPKRIVALRWGGDGRLVVDLKATRKMVDESVLAEADAK